MNILEKITVFSYGQLFDSMYSCDLKELFKIEQKVGNEAIAY